MLARKFSSVPIFVKNPPTKVSVPQVASQKDGEKDLVSTKSLGFT